jgi:dipeptidyl aminopeptidase/acylaminoacyl peptidase
MKHLLLINHITLALLLGATTAAAAETAALVKPLVPVEDFVRRPKLDRITFSPSGKQFAALSEINGRMNLLVVDVDKGDIRQVSSFENSDVAGFRWISDGRLVLSLTDYRRGLAEQTGGGLMAVDADGRGGRTLSPTQQECMDANKICRSTEFFERVPGSEDEIIAWSNERSADSPDLVRLNTRTGKRTLITEDNPGSVRHWALDLKLQARAALSVDSNTLASTFWYRDSERAPWRKMAVSPAFQPEIEPLAFDKEGNLYVATALESKDKKAIYKFDPVTGKLGEKIAAHPRFDLGLAENPRNPGRAASPLIFDPLTHALIGLRIAGDKTETVWFEEKLAKVQSAMDTTLPKGNVNSLQPLADGQIVINTGGGSDPGATYLYDPVKAELREVVRPRAWLDRAHAAEVRVIRYKARDGLEIPAYLTLPAGKEAKKLPLVAWIHGGPWARDDYSWDPDAQFLASRGYAVLQPNYRGSMGFGSKHLYAGFKQLGQSMQDDVTDGIAKLIADGVVDAERVCIGGASYGGYATLMGLAREPGLFKCGIDVVGVSDLTWWLELGYTDFNQSTAAGAGTFLREAIGNPTTDRAMMDAHSPRQLAAKIKAPLLIIHGAGDRRVPIVHAEAMRDALTAQGRPPEWLVFPDEGHGFMLEANRIAYYKRIEAFLAKHLGR